MRRILAVALALVLVVSPLAVLPVTAPTGIGSAAAQDTNVTYSGTLSLSGTPVGDGATYQYEISDLDAAQDFTINVTGATNYDRENATGQVGNGESVPLDIAGNAQPVGPSGSTPMVELTGTETKSTVSSSFTGLTASSSSTETVGGNKQPTNVQVVFEGAESTTAASTSETGASDGSSTSYSVGGNIEPTGPSTNNEPELTFTGRESASANDQSGSIVPGNSDSVSVTGNVDPVGPSSNNKPELTLTAGTSESVSQYSSSDGTGAIISGTYSSEQRIDNPPSTITDIRWEISGTNGDTPYNCDIYIVGGESADRDWTDGTKVANDWDPSSGTGTKTVSIGSYDASAYSKVTVGTVCAGGGTMNANYDSGAVSGSYWAIDDGTGDYFGRAHEVYLESKTTGISVSDGQGTSVSFGDFASQESKTKEFPISADASSLSISGTGPSIDWTLDKDDRTATEDPSIDWNNDGTTDASYSGMLLSGETASIEVAGLSTGSHTASTSLTAGSVDWSLDWTEITATEDPALNIDGTLAASHSGILRAGETATTSVTGLELGSNSLAWDATAAGGGFDANLSYDEVRVSEDPAVDTDNDGTYEITKTGELSDGSTVRYEAPGITKSVSSLPVSTTNASSVQVRAEYRERTKTDSPAVETNGNTVSYTGLMDDGQTQTLTSDPAWLQSGTNRVNVSVGSGSLSADAPSPQVEFRYSHDAIDDQSVTYQSEAFTERYSVSRTWSSDQSNAELTIPFDGNVISVRDAIKRENSGSWASVPDGERNLTTAGGSSTLDVELGSVSSGTTIDVKVNGSKISVNNGTIDVLESTAEGRELNSKIELTSWGSDSYILMPSTGQHNRVPYAYNESWGADDHVWVSSDGEKRLTLPNGANGNVARISNIPVEAAPKTGDVVIEVNRVNESNPKFEVRPGQQQGDEVAFTFVEAVDGETYELWSTSSNERRDSGTASSPLTLSDDDSSETLVFRGYTGSSDSGGGTLITGRVPVQSGQQSSSTEGIVLFAGVGLVILVGIFWYVRRRARPDKGIARAVARFVATPVVLAGLGILATVIALNYNLLGLPVTVKLIGGLAGILTAVFYILQRLGIFQWRVFGTVAFVVSVLGAEALRPGLLAFVIGSDAFQKLLPLLILAGVYLVYKAIQTWRRGQVTRVVVGGSE